jgi:hypothetical protein
MNRFRSHLTIHLALWLAPACVFASVGSQARVEPQGTPGEIKTTYQSQSSDLSVSFVAAGIGFASAGAASGPGTLVGMAWVSLESSNRYATGAFTALASGFTTEQMRVDSFYCTPATCVDAVALGIDHLAFTVDIHASGGIGAFRGQSFDNVSASAGFDWQLAGMQGGPVSGGGQKSRNNDDPVVGSIDNQSATVVVKPGAALELKLHMDLGAQASLAGAIDHDASGAMADFTHTLRWMGVTSLQAFDAGGQEITLAEGGRFSIFGSSGHDFWDAAPVVTLTLVPEPGTWALMLGGLALLGRRQRFSARRVRSASPRPAG